MKKVSGRVDTNVRPFEDYVFNDERAARIANRIFCDDWKSADPESPSSEHKDLIMDAIADLMHLCDYFDFDFAYIFEWASHHYSCEVEDEEKLIAKGEIIFI